MVKNEYLKDLPLVMMIFRLEQEYIIERLKYIDESKFHQHYLDSNSSVYDDACKYAHRKLIDVNGVKKTSIGRLLVVDVDKLFRTRMEWDG